MSEVRVGDCVEVMRGMGDNSVDACVTDPPYHLTQASRGGSPRNNDPATPFGRHRVGEKGFMGKTWDGGGVAFTVELWEQVLRVLQPGAYLLAFGGTRTYHRMACAIEDAGFEIHDCLSWLYGSGFPKHKSKLKPAWEPIVMARKPAPRATLLNIDACRIEGGARPHIENSGGKSAGVYSNGHKDGSRCLGVTTTGRWPANVVLDEVASQSLDEMSGDLTSNSGKPFKRSATDIGFTRGTDGENAPAFYGDTGGASRFFFVAREPNASAPNDPLILRRAKAILWAWNPDLASTADDRSSLSSEHAVSVLSRVVTAASHGEIQLNGLTGLSTSVTPTALSALCQSVIALILNSASAFSREQQHARRIQSGNHANGAAHNGPTGTTTAMIGRSTSDGSAVVATLTATSHSSEVGEADSPSSRFIYCAKASRAEREAGLDGMPMRSGGSLATGKSSIPIKEGRDLHRTNHHPTVKPVALMRWLVRLVTPPDGIVLDPFAGSGTTGIAATLEGRRFVGIEREAEYVEIARARIQHHTPKQTALEIPA